MSDVIAIRTHGGEQWVWYYCAGCKQLHGVPSKRWNWNGSITSPTLSPSVRHYFPASEYGPEKTTCHYFVRDGRIEFCGDCEHELSGKIVDMTEPTNVPNDS